ncbi:Catechol 2,3-dioxygenase [Microbulbifer donghaiensis]|uniref:Catechol 2,3-dioxygenase n=1 Tax=Microbulbifer donghaiensis TaxID=494016 RepID=A0A1M5B6Z1_9GAMM|nr:VOC family protein [Microbulbifer donghaiensis]SHF38067.1 Catechol 2,3-dioxygenase [Microbulbifer donghaiensis]
MGIKRIHHVAYRCRDAKETVEFYRDLLGMDFQLAIAENEVPSTKEPDPYMHVFLDAGMGNVLAFFEIPNSPDMGRDENTPKWVQHIAFEVEDMDELLAARDRLEAAGVDVLGPTDHTIFQSIYFFDPNGHRIELAANTAKPGMHSELKRVAEDMLDEWARTKKAPRHAAWMHGDAEFEPTVEVEAQ